MSESGETQVEIPAVLDSEEQIDLRFRVMDRVFDFAGARPDLDPSDVMMLASWGIRFVEHGADYVEAKMEKMIEEIKASASAGEDVEFDPAGSAETAGQSGP